MKPRKRKDEDSGLAAIDRESMRELGVSSGEFVPIEGRDGDLEAVCREAAQTAVREHVRRRATGEAADVDDIEITAEHFESALESVDAEGESFDGSGEPLLAGGDGTA